MKIQPLRTDGCFEEVMEKYSDMIYRIAYANVRVKADAEYDKMKLNSVEAFAEQFTKLLTESGLTN